MLGKIPKKATFLVLDFDWRRGMGIRGFARWLKGRCPAAFSGTGSVKNFDNVYIDINPMLHTISRHEHKESRIFNRARFYLTGQLKETTPKNELFLTMDGPAGISKFAEQRQRRAKIISRLNEFDTRQLTPGCLFMTRFEEELDLISRQILPNYPGLKVWISGAATFGEGEHKIFNQLLKDNSSSKVLLATDNDAYAFGMCHPIKNLLICRPVWEGISSSEFREFDPNLAIQLLAKECGNYLDQTRVDFALMTAFSANDYLPSMQFAQLPQLWPAYCKTSRPLTLVDLSSMQINLPQLKELMSFYYKNCFEISLKGLQEVRLMESNKNSELSARKIANYLSSIHSVLHQITGHRSNRFIPYDYQEAPSAAELAEMDVSLIEKLMREEMGKENLRVDPLPGTTAIMVFDLTDSTMAHLPIPSQKVAKEYQTLRDQSHFKDDKDATIWINRQIEGLRNSSAMKDLEFKTIYSRSPYCFASGKIKKRDHNVTLSQRN